MLKPETYYEEIEAYIENGEKAPANYAHVLDIGVTKFLWMVQQYKEKGREKMNETPATRGKWKRLNQTERELVYEAIKNGGNIKSVADRFSISVHVARRIFSTFEENKPSVSNSIEISSDLPATVLLGAQIARAEDIGVFIEEEFIVFRMPKKAITRELLRGIL